ncbi:MAG TPA: D-alanine--D-alanine ligase [Oscillatoriales cyanobacterium M59_W2019_021]|nr:MAG: D-alanine--D-alanine ligase [Cyanobacteria bacterium J055]HIK32631.1 D-alanine--D-alanine ligase [Oscillatoriales cyanobacterium M4454_W2019_049]HIK50618.1 D-alanine--D-alanine ligase [Oscillatoriales cyanobacterium M59_W2019_021]
MSLLRVLHLVGSAENNFYGDLSRLYAGDCLRATANPDRYEFYIAYISPDGQWRFPPSVAREDIAATPPMSVADAIAWIIAKNIDLVLPQMFCLPGMTQYRALFDVLKIPYIGNRSDVMAIAAHKAKAKAIVAAAGVKVPAGELLRRGDVPTVKLPAVIKPASADNSSGVTLVKNFSDYDAALQTAFEYDDEVVVEEYIELGREVRCGILVRDGELAGLPLEEYRVNSQDHPIRNYADKLQQTEDGELFLSAKDNIKAWTIEPSDPITEAVWEAAKKCHQALGCRHYSLFDFRIDPQGQPWFLEAGLYCSFSPKSVVATMAKAAGVPVDQLLQIAIDETLESRRAR